MVIRKFLVMRTPSQDEVLNISTRGFYFSSKFIQNNNLLNKNSLTIYWDDDDPYWLGFEFFDDKNIGTTKLLKSGHQNSRGRSIKGMEIINQSKILKSIKDDPSKVNRTFNIQKDKQSGLFFILLRPSFELKVLFDKRNSINDELSGIYRYKDKIGNVLYIGKGNIKTRSNSPERNGWGIYEIEYSVVSSDEDSLKWESYHLQMYQNDNGLLPPFNRISGHGKE